VSRTFFFSQLFLISCLYAVEKAVHISSLNIFKLTLAMLTISPLAFSSFAQCTEQPLILKTPGHLCSSKVDPGFYVQVLSGFVFADQFLSQSPRVTTAMSSTLCSHSTSGYGNLSLASFVNRSQEIPAGPCKSVIMLFLVLRHASFRGSL